MGIETTKKKKPQQNLNELKYIKKLVCFKLNNKTLSFLRKCYETDRRHLNANSRTVKVLHRDAGQSCRSKSST